jgi:holliday junction DNA helicase RuvA
VIASVRGTVLALAPGSAVVEVGGVGLDVQCVPAALAGLRVGHTATLATTLVVREDSLTLFGFDRPETRDLFVVLQSVTGIGPRIAQAVLAVLEPDALRSAVAREDLAALTRVPGIGRKGAARIVLELTGKLGPAVGTGAVDGPSEGPPAPDWEAQVHTGLVGLGWSSRDADGAVEAVRPLAADQTAAGEVNVGGLLRAALQRLARG